MVTSHATDTDARGRPLSPSAPFQPHEDITRIADGWLIRQRVEAIEESHLWREVMERPACRQAVLDCVSCGRGIFILSPDVDRLGYQVNVMQLRAAIVSHLHNHHEEMLNGPRRNTGTGWPAPAAPGTDHASPGDDSYSGGDPGDRSADQTGHHHPGDAGQAPAR